MAQRFRIGKIVPFGYPRWSLAGLGGSVGCAVPICKMAAMEAILKFFKGHQTGSWIEPKLDGKHWSDIHIQNCLNCSIWLSKMAFWAAILKILKPHLLPNSKSDRAQTWCEALGPHGDLELIKSFRSDIQDGRHVSHLENLQTASPLAVLKVFNCYLLPNSVRWSGNLVEGIGAAWRFRIAKMVPVWFKMVATMAAILKIFKSHLLPNGKSDWA